MPYKNLEDKRANDRAYSRTHAEHKRQASADWYAQNTERSKKKTAKYQSQYRNGASGGRATPGNSGEAAELLVGSDLLTRGLAVTKPLNRNGKDDLHVKVATGWKSVQVKVGGVNTKTGCLYARRRAGVTSDLYAVVDLIDKRIRYLSLPGTEVPPELL